MNLAPAEPIRCTCCRQTGAGDDLCACAMVCRSCGETAWSNEVHPIGRGLGAICLDCVRAIYQAHTERT